MASSSVTQFLLFVLLLLTCANAVKLRTRVSWESLGNEIDSGAIFLNRTVGRACANSAKYLRYSGDRTEPSAQEDVITFISEAREAGDWSDSVNVFVRADWFSNRPPPSDGAIATLTVTLLDDNNAPIGRKISNTIFPDVSGDCPKFTAAVVNVRYNPSSKSYSFSVTVRQPPPFVLLSMRVSWNGPPRSEVDTAVSFKSSPISNGKCPSSGSSSYVSLGGDNTRNNGFEVAEISLSDALSEGVWNNSVMVRVRASWAGRYGPLISSRVLLSAVLVNEQNQPISQNITSVVYPGPIANCPLRPIASFRVSHNDDTSAYSLVQTSLRPPPSPVATLRVWVTWFSRNSDVDTAIEFNGEQVNQCSGDEHGKFLEHRSGSNLFVGREEMRVAVSAAREAGIWTRRMRAQVRATWSERPVPKAKSGASVYAALYLDDEIISGSILRQRIFPGVGNRCGNFKTVANVSVTYNPGKGTYKIGLKAVSV